MKPAKTAFLILAHTDPAQLHRLVWALGPDCDCFIHLDKHASAEPFKKLQFPPNTQFITNQVKVNWAGFSIVQATLNLIKAALDAGFPYQYLVLLSGMDYPIKPPAALYEFLNKNAGTEFIRSIPMERVPDFYMFRVNRYFFRDDLPFITHRQARRGVRFVLENITARYKRKMLPGVVPHAGSQWWAITRECAAFILDFVDRNPKFVQFYRHTFAPDEHFFQTIVANSHFAARVQPQSEPLKPGPEHYASLHIVHPSLQKVFQLSDFEEIKASDKFFVRKVNSKHSVPLLDKIDQQLLQRTPNQQANMHT